MFPRLYGHSLTMWLSRRGSIRRVRRRQPAAVFPLVEPLEGRCLPSFAGAALSFDAGSNPRSVAVADFNGDGIPDLAVANQGTYPGYADSSVSVLLGHGDGSFQAPRSFAAGISPAAVAVGDFNGDGIPDLAVVNEGGFFDFTNASVSVLLGNGDGSFQPARTLALAAGSRPMSVAVGDFNGDGTLDLAIANYGGNTVSVLLGHGDGSFGAPRSFAAGTSPAAVAVGDFNGDGIQDLAVANEAAPGTVSILLGNGDGSFRSPASLEVDNFLDALAVADFNGDGVPDLAVAYRGHYPDYTGGVRVLLGNGDGSFRTTFDTTLRGSTVSAVAVGDFNGDGVPDLAVTPQSDGEVSVLLGHGDGAFGPAQLYPVGAYSQSVAVGDFNGDGASDLAVVSGDGNNVSVLLGNGDGTFSLGAPRVPAGSQPVVLAAGDFNGDGIPDLAVVSDGLPGSVGVLLGNGDGSFRDAGNDPVGPTPTSVAVGDFNGDGIPDLAVVNSGGVPNGTVSVLLGNGDGSFRPAITVPAGYNPTSLAVADFNGDGRLDLVVTAGRPAMVEVLLGNGDGSFGAPRSFAAGASPAFVAVGDFNGDGTPDVVVTNTDIRLGSRTVSVLLGNGDGSFQGPVAYTVGLNPTSVAVGDFNGDGRLDLAVANGGSASVSVLLGNGNGTFQDAPDFAAGGGPGPVVVGDFNGDGLPDLAVLGGGGVKVLLGNGDGSFQTSATSYLAGQRPLGLAVTDLNRDGQPDLAVANYYSNDVSILLNDGAWSAGLPPAAGRRRVVAAETSLTVLAVPELRADSPVPAATLELAAEPVGPGLRETGRGDTADVATPGRLPLDAGTSRFVPQARRQPGPSTSENLLRVLPDSQALRMDLESFPERSPRRSPE